MMFNKRKRSGPEVRNSSEDDNLPFRKQQKIQSTGNLFFVTTSTETFEEGRSNSGRITPYLDGQSSQNRSDTSSSSESEEIFQPVRRKLLRPLSDYETGDSNDKEDAMHTVSKNRFNMSYNIVKSSHYAGLPSMLSSNHSLTKGRLDKQLKIKQNYISTSDSSDSGMPIRFKRTRRRKKLSSTNSEECDSDNSYSNVYGSSIQSGLGKQRKIKPNHISTSDSSDSVTPIGFKRRRRSMKLSSTSSEESDSDDSYSNILDGNIQGKVDKQRNMTNNTTSNSSESNISFAETSSEESSTDSFYSADDGRSSIDRNNYFTNRSHPIAHPVTKQSRNIGGVATFHRQSDSTSTNTESDSDYENVRVCLRRTAARSNVPLLKRTNVRMRADAQQEVTQLSLSNSTQQSRSVRVQIMSGGSGNVSSNSSTEESNSSAVDSRFTSYPSNLLGLSSNREETVNQIDNFGGCCVSDDSDESLPIQYYNRRGAHVRIPESEDENTVSVNPISNNISHSGKADSTNINCTSNPLTQKVLTDSDVEIEKCPICLDSFKKQQVGIPTCCGHCFCAKCILQWIHTNSTCPIDRQAINSIEIRSHFKGRLIHKEKVESVKPELPEFEEDVIPLTDESSSDSPDELDAVCCICFRTNDNNIIFCDNCYNIYHMNCLNPPLRYLPVTDWYCPPCVVELPSLEIT